MPATISAPPAKSEPKVSASPVEYVRSLEPDDKQAVFVSLLREALAINGDSGLLPIEDENGNPFGYYVPPNAAQALSDRIWNDTPADVRKALSEPVTNLDRSISSEEMLAILSSGDASPR